VKYWEIVADNLKKPDGAWAGSQALDSNWRTIWIVDAHRDDGKRYVVRAVEMLTAFIEIASAVCSRN
jgi:hypothetical protein